MRKITKVVLRHQPGASGNSPFRIEQITNAVEVSVHGQNYTAVKTVGDFLSRLEARELAGEKDVEVIVKAENV